MKQQLADICENDKVFKEYVCHKIYKKIRDRISDGENAHWAKLLTLTLYIW